MNFVMNKSKYRRNSRKIDSKCIKNDLKLQMFSPAASIGTGGKYFKNLRTFLNISHKSYLIFSKKYI